MNDLQAIRLNSEDRRVLLSLARRSVLHRLQHQHPYTVDMENYGSNLKRRGASFVTLKKAGSLRGCIGALEASQPLVVDVVTHAEAAAFRDPRFEPVCLAEFEALRFEISVLTTPESLAVENEDELISRLRPGVDGLIIQQGKYRATYLPSVWEQLPLPELFLAQLKRKAGIPAAASKALQAWRYQTITFADE